MNSYRISGTLSITGPDGEMITLGMLSNDADSRLVESADDAEPINWPSGWSGTFTVSTDDNHAAKRFFEEMQADWVLQQLRDALRDHLPLLISAEPVRRRQIGAFDLSRALCDAMQSPVIHEARKVAQWKRERSPMRYSSRR